MIWLFQGQNKEGRIKSKMFNMKNYEKDDVRKR